MAELRVRVTPKAVREGVGGWREGELKVRVTAAPEGGKATAAVRRLLAESLGVPKSAVAVSRGETSRHKTLRIEGADDERLREVFGRPD